VRTTRSGIAVLLNNEHSYFTILGTGAVCSNRGSCRHEAGSDIQAKVGRAISERRIKSNSKLRSESRDLNFSV
jgi:hypothetical protein